MRTIPLLLIIALIPVFSFAQKPGPQKGASPASEAPESIAILSIIPAQGEPGRTVTLYGTGFTDRTAAFLGNFEVPTRVMGPRQLTFDIPNIPAGLYALFLRRPDGSASKIYNFSILPAKPAIVSITPDRVYACSTGRDREVTIIGRNFVPGSQVLFDGAAIRGTLNSSESISFLVPQVQGGLHQVQVKNPEDTTSTIYGVFIDAKPEIDNVTQGAELVNAYELIITGKNFQPGGTLLVDGRRIPVGAPNVLDRDNAVYVDCTRIIYNRYPYDPVVKTFQIQLVNPNNEVSNPIQVSGP